MDITNLDNFHTFVGGEVINFAQINKNNEIILDNLKNVVNIQFISQTDYDNLEEKQPNVLYCIISQ